MTRNTGGADSAIERMERRRAKAEEADNRAMGYLREVAKRRLQGAGAMTGDIKRSPAEVHAFQMDVYRTLGLSGKAGYEGAPPSFHQDEEVNEKSGALNGHGFRSRTNDPLQKLFRAKHITDLQFASAIAYLDMMEELRSLGLKAVEYGERVDGGRLPNVPVMAMERVNRARQFVFHMSLESLGYCQLMEHVCMERRTIRSLAPGQWGKSHQTVARKFKAALDRAALFFYPSPEKDD